MSKTNSKENLPLIVYIQGSGMNSLFIEKDNKVLTTMGQKSWNNMANDKCRILVVEKLGVAFLQHGPSAIFDEKFSLQSWGNYLFHTINYVLKHEKINKEKVLLAGHSEGGVVAAYVSNLLKNKASHVAIMSGEGPSQLYSLFQFANEGFVYNESENNLNTKAEKIAYLEEVWKDILAHPKSTEKKFWGLTYLRWSSLLDTSVIDELTPYKGKILLVQGTLDKAVHPSSALIAYATLLSKGRDVKLLEIENADHSYNILNEKNIDGWEMVIGQIIE